MTRNAPVPSTHDGSFPSRRAAQVGGELARPPPSTMPAAAWARWLTADWVMPEPLRGLVVRQALGDQVGDLPAAGGAPGEHGRPQPQRGLQRAGVGVVAERPAGATGCSWRRSRPAGRGGTPVRGRPVRASGSGSSTSPTPMPDVPGVRRAAALDDRGRSRGGIVQRRPGTRRRPCARSARSVGAPDRPPAPRPWPRHQVGSERRLPRWSTVSTARIGSLLGHVPTRIH